MAKATKPNSQTRSKPSSSRSSKPKAMSKAKSISSNKADPVISTHSKATPIPNEIILHILTHLSDHQPSLLSCILVSKSFHTLASPFLWTSLKLTPFSITTRPGDSTSQPNRLEDPKKSHCGALGTGKKDLKHLLKHVQKVYLQSHTPEWCLHSHSSSLRLPNLDVLDLDIIPQPGARKVHLTDPMRGGGYNPTCRLLRDLSPSRVILRDNFNKGLDLSKGAIPTSIWKCVDELVLVSEVRDIPSLGLEPVTAPIPITLKNLERLIWIFLPSNEEKVMYRLDAPHRPDLYNAMQIINLIVQLDHLKSVKLVNPGVLGGLIEENGGATRDQLHFETCDYIRGKFGEETRKRGWMEGKIAEVRGRIEFMGLEEWGEEGGWVGRFDEGEIDGWMGGI
ncbi:hypothetical protein I302_100400 [Kwoniella bestiolae CBS 10118]|uniref:F-box domain-containing protein n=1 Tax=Kwoniella bestiolae CBS 10118 TaxID=1296100 RepID=A0A1B9G4Y4_9TREE|nr:hypothetical protein I302_03774 [Kwoniella bestiolae CBS 10118]OCF26097.1 hypothetical protein I302_03774 [Kwoniella bestiolae CBS 10118]